MTNINVVAYKSAYKDAFKKLNQEWIEKYFKMEKADYESLDFPEEKIIDKGGAILFIVVEDQPIATAALIKREDEYDFELAKMAVSPIFQGQRLGYLLLTDTIEKAREMGAKTIYLESSRKLKVALNLYRKLGFKEVTGVHTPYDRCDIQMVLALEEPPLTSS